MNKSKQSVAVVIPNLNGDLFLVECIDSLISQSYKTKIVVVDNNSEDGSVKLINEKYNGEFILIKNNVNKGFAGGVNDGIKYCLSKDFEFIGLLNNDAYVDKNWIESLINSMARDSAVGITTSTMINPNSSKIDSTGECYTNWGLPYPRGRGDKNSSLFATKKNIFGASGGASLYRASMLKEIGLFDEDFFAYYEDVDISFRAQLAGWKILYEPSAVAYHEIGATSSKIPGFTTYQTIKNLPWLFWKNVPRKYLFSVGIRFYLAYFLFVVSALSRGQFGPVVKGLFVSTILLPKKLVQRHKIQSSAKVSPEYIWSIMTHDLPPNAIKLRKIRSFYHKLIKKV